MIVESNIFPIETAVSDDPIIGYNNVVTRENVSANSEDVRYPASNVANPSTALKWSAGFEYYYQFDIRLSATIPADSFIDYVAIARHNLSSGSANCPVTIQGRTGTGPFTTLVQQTTLNDNSPTIFRWAGADTYTEIAISMAEGNDPPSIAVIYIGQLLRLQRRIYVGHTPINFGRVVKEATGVSEMGNFLGSLTLQEGRRSAVSLKNLTPSWYRESFDPFLESALSNRNPFFFGWRPRSYPNESGYAWLTGNPAPVNTLPNGMMGIDFQMEGVT